MFQPFQGFISTLIKKLTFALALTGLVFSWGCGKDDPASDSTYFYRIPWGTNGSYTLTEVPIHTLNSPERLDGKAATVFAGGDLIPTGIDGPVLEPDLLQTSENQFVPKDYNSSAAISLYAHIEQLMNLDENLGVKQNLSWPRKVLFRPDFATDGGSHNNAFYIGDNDTMVFQHYSLDSLPIPVNGGVIAHEHFHAHFFARMLSKYISLLPSRREQDIRMNSAFRFMHGSLSAVFEPHDMVSTLRPFFSNEAVFYKRNGEPLSKSQAEIFMHNFDLIRAWNEGLADYWGFMYSGDLEYIGRSIPGLRSRSLKKTSEIKFSDKSFNEQISGKKMVFDRSCQCPWWMSQEECVDHPGRRMCVSYRWGTQFARVLMEVSQTEDLTKMGEQNNRTAFEELAIHINKRLPLLAHKDPNQLYSVKLRPMRLIRVLFAKSSYLTPQTCEIIRKSLGKKDHPMLKEKCK